MAPQKEVVMKLSSLRYIKPGVSEQALHDYATRDHAPRAAVLQERHGILKVSHFHTPSATRDILKQEPFVHALQPGWEVADYDIIVNFYVRDKMDLMNLLADPDFQAMMKEEVDIVDPARAHLTVGWEEVYVEDGKVVNVTDGKSEYPQFAESIATVTGNKPASG